MHSFSPGLLYSDKFVNALGTRLTALVVVEGPGSSMLQVGATGNSSRCFSGSMFICGGPGASLGVSDSVDAGGVEPGSDAEGTGRWAFGLIAVYSLRKWWLQRVTYLEWNMQMRYCLFERTSTMHPVLSHFLSFS